MDLLILAGEILALHSQLANDMITHSGSHCLSLTYKWLQVSWLSCLLQRRWALRCCFHRFLQVTQANRRQSERGRQVWHWTACMSNRKQERTQRPCLHASPNVYMCLLPAAEWWGATTDAVLVAVWCSYLNHTWWHCCRHHCRHHCCMCWCPWLDLQQQLVTFSFHTECRLTIARQNSVVNWAKYEQTVTHIQCYSWGMLIQLQATSPFWRLWPDCHQPTEVGSCWNESIWPAG